MELGILNEDNLLDVMKAPQLYTIELWVEKIEINKNQNTTDTSKKNLLEDSSKTTSKSKQINDDSSTSRIRQTPPLSNSSEISIKKAHGIKGHKPKNKKHVKKYQKVKRFHHKDDYILPSGLKPLRIKFDIFDLKKITLTQIEFGRLFHFTHLSDTGNFTSSEENLTMKEASPTTSTKMKSDHSTVGSKHKDHTIQTSTHSDENKKNELKDTHPSNKTDSSGSKLDDDSRTHLSKKVKSKEHGKGGSHKKHETQPGKEKKFQLTQFRKSIYSDFIFTIDEIIDLIDEDIFIPKDECNIKKGGCVTFAKAPLELIQLMQSNNINISIDRYGGRLDDQGEPVGEAKIMFPSEWKETVFKIATKPSLSPDLAKINGTVSIIEKPSKEEVGHLEYALLITCYSRCVITDSMPSQKGLYVVLSEGMMHPSHTLCQKPITRNNINYHSLKKKAEQDNYKVLFQPTSRI